MKRPIILFALTLLAAAACQRTVLTGPETIPFVRQVAADSAGTGLFDRVRHFDPSNTEGTIAVIGESRHSLLLTLKLLGGDSFDNVDGRKVEDGLPDFAGEVVAAYLDERNQPYSALVEDGRGNYLRETAVRLFLEALDTAVRVSPYDRDHLRSKPVAKVIILASPLLSEYGYADIDTLVHLSGVSVPVISPVHAMLSDAVSEKPANIGVWLSEDQPDGSAYEKVLAKLGESDSNAAKSTLKAFVPDSVGTLGDRFVKYLEMYRDSGAEGQLSCLLLDDYGADLFELRDRLAEIRRAETFETLNLNKILAQDFRFIHIVDALDEACYRTMRQRNLFTHFVAYPKADYYVTAVAAPVEDLPFTVIANNRRYLSEQTIQLLEYVQN